MAGANIQLLSENNHFKAVFLCMNFKKSSKDPFPFSDETMQSLLVKMLPVTELMNISDATFVKSSQSSATTEHDTTNHILEDHSTVLLMGATQT